MSSGRSWTPWFGSDPSFHELYSSVTSIAYQPAPAAGAASAPTGTTDGCEPHLVASSHGDVTLVDGDRVFGEFEWGVTTQISLDDDQLACIAGHDIVHTSIYSKLDGQLDRLAAAAKVLSFDFASDWTRETLAGILPHVDIAFLSHPGADEGAVRELLAWHNQRDLSTPPSYGLPAEKEQKVLEAWHARESAR